MLNAIGRPPIPVCRSVPKLTCICWRHGCCFVRILALSPSASCRTACHPWLTFQEAGTSNTDMTGREQRKKRIIYHINYCRMPIAHTCKKI